MVPPEYSIPAPELIQKQGWIDRPKYRGVPVCFSYSGEFRSFSAIFSFWTGTNITGFLKKNLILTATSDHHWSINLLDHQQHHLLLRFSHLDLLFSHCNHSLLHLLSPCFVCSACWNSLSTFLRSFLCLEESRCKI